MLLAEFQALFRLDQFFHQRPFSVEGPSQGTILHLYFMSPSYLISSVIVSQSFYVLDEP